MRILVIFSILTSIDALCFETGSSTYGGVHALCLLLGQESKRPRWQEEEARRPRWQEEPPASSSASSATAGHATRENADDAEPQPLPTNDDEQKARFKEEQKESEAIYLMRRYIGGVTGVLLCPLP